MTINVRAGEPKRQPEPINGNVVYVHNGRSTGDSFDYAAAITAANAAAAEQRPEPTGRKSPTARATARRAPRTNRQRVAGSVPAEPAVIAALKAFRDNGFSETVILDNGEPIPY